MGIVPTHLLQGPQKMLSLVSQRQEALSDNIANMHTEGYRRKDSDRCNETGVFVECVT